MFTRPKRLILLLIPARVMRPHFRQNVRNFFSARPALVIRRPARLDDALHRGWCVTRTELRAFPGKNSDSRRQPPACCQKEPVARRLPKGSLRGRKHPSRMILDRLQIVPGRSTRRSEPCCSLHSRSSMFWTYSLPLTCQNHKFGRTFPSSTTRSQPSSPRARRTRPSCVDMQYQWLFPSKCVTASRDLMLSSGS